MIGNGYTGNLPTRCMIFKQIRIHCPDTLQFQEMTIADIALCQSTTSPDFMMNTHNTLKTYVWSRCDRSSSSYFITCRFSADLSINLRWKADQSVDDTSVSMRHVRTIGTFGYSLFEIISITRALHIMSNVSWQKIASRALFN